MGLGGGGAETDEKQPQSFQEIPVIDVSPLLRLGLDNADVADKNHDANSADVALEEVARSVEVQQAANEIHRACLNVGFFYVVGHGMPADLIDGVRAVSREFFELPDDEKQKIDLKNSPLFRGYQRLGLNVTKGSPDWHEAVDLFKEVPQNHPDVVAGKPLHGPNQWPAVPADFRPRMLRYVEAMIALGRILMRAISLALGLPLRSFEGQLAGDPFWVLRAIGYPPLPGDNLPNGGGVPEAKGPNGSNVSISCGEHTDYGLLTFVNQDNDVTALQVKNRMGVWIDVKPVDGAFVVNIGDMLKIWTNGMYQPTPHRVINGGASYRISVPFFYEPNFDAIVEPFDTCVRSSGKKPLYSSIVYGDHLVKKVLNNFK